MHRWRRRRILKKASEAIIVSRLEGFTVVVLEESIFVHDAML